MSLNRPEFLSHGERARLFPVLSDSSKEGRATSIFLACLANVEEFSDELLSSVGRKIGKTSRVRSYTEVCFKNSGSEMEGRPDGLIEVKTGKNFWNALVEAKIGNAELNSEQISTYLRIARANDIDAVITISNQFASSPTHHPVDVDKRLLKSVSLFHWSWMHILTTADLLLTNEQIADADQRVILNELRRFLSHDSTGVRGFEKMPKAWPEVVRGLEKGQQISPRTEGVNDIIVAWHQELRDLGLILSRQIGVQVSTKLSKELAKDQHKREKRDIQVFASESKLEAALLIPEAAANLDLCVDARARNISASMKIAAPADRKSTAARINWLLRQISNIDTKDVFVRVFWPRRGFVQFELAALLEDVSVANNPHALEPANFFEVAIIRNTRARFVQLKGFIEDLEDLVPEFYSRIGVKLKVWRPPSPKIRDDRLVSDDVTPEAIAEDAEEAVDRGLDS